MSKLAGVVRSSSDSSPRSFVRPGRDEGDRDHSQWEIGIRSTFRLAGVFAVRRPSSVSDERVPGIFETPGANV
jgi:hypothetical protein